MPTIEEYKLGVKTVSPTPTGDAGAMIDGNFRTVADLIESQGQAIGGKLSADAPVARTDQPASFSEGVAIAGSGLTVMPAGGSTSLDVSPGYVDIYADGGISEIFVHPDRVFITAGGPGGVQLNGSNVNAGMGDGSVAGGVWNLEGGNVVGVGTLQAATINGGIGTITGLTANMIAGLATAAKSGAYADLSGRPTLGTAAAANTGTTAGAVPTVGTDPTYLPKIGFGNLTITANGDIQAAAGKNLTFRSNQGGVVATILDNAIFNIGSIQSSSVGGYKFTSHDGLPTCVLNTETQPVIIGGTTSTLTGYVIDMALPTTFRSNVTVGGTTTATTGNIVGLSITRTVNQTTGLASNVQLLVDLTEAAVRPTTQQFAAFKRNGVQNWACDTAGSTTQAGNAAIGGTANITGRLTLGNTLRLSTINPSTTPGTQIGELANSSASGKTIEWDGSAWRELLR